MPSIRLQDYLKKTPRARLNNDMKFAQEYIREQAFQLDREMIRRGPQGRFVSKFITSPRDLVIGQMYLFVYDAKWKHKLPYWDMHPLIFPFDIQEDRWLGLNLHYLPINYRVVLMDALYDLASQYDPDADNPVLLNTTLQVSYGLLKNTAKYRYYKPCVHEYLNNHVQSRFLIIPATKWINALLMPTQAFTGPRSTDVYSDSLRKIGRN